MKELLHDDDVREEGRAAGLSEGLDRGRREGLSEGRTEGKRTAAINLKAMNMPIEQIAQVLEENVEVVEQWLADSVGSRSNAGGIPLAKI